MSDLEVPRTDPATIAPSQNPQDPSPILAPSGPVLPEPVRVHRMLRHGREGRQQAARDRSMLMNLRRWSKADPDIAAEAEQIGLDLEVGADIAEADMEGAREIQRARQFNAFVQTGGDPVLMEMLIDPRFARIAHDDLEELERAGETSRQWTAGRLGDERSRIQLRQMMSRGSMSEQDALRLQQIDEQQSVLPEGATDQDYGLATPWYGAVRMLGGMWSTLGHAVAAGSTLR